MTKRRSGSDSRKEMNAFIARVIYFFDRLFPRARVGGRGSGDAYAEWEYREGKALLERYAGLFGALEGESLLDIGCGMGGKTTAYAETGARTIGADISEEHVAASVRFAASKGLKALFVPADAGALPFTDGTFDLVVANDSLEHFPDPARALGELSRVLRSGGRIFVFFTPWGSPLGSHLYDYIRTPWCHLLFGERLIEELLRVVLSGRGEPEPAARASALMEEYRSELNRITVRQFRRIRREHPELETVTERLVPPKYRFLAPLARLPLLGELCTGTVVVLLRKK
jgi:ubiquinone/menaquinone biosynthesis C-methylase UbiE